MLQLALNINAREEHLIVGVIFLKIVVLCLNDYLFAKRGRTRRDID